MLATVAHVSAQGSYRLTVGMVLIPVMPPIT